MAVVNANQTNVRQPCLSIGIIAWNEEKAIGPMLQSLFQQSLFAELSRRGLTCEILCITNGCTDRTAEVASEIFAEQKRSHPHDDAFTCQTVNLEERGKLNAWNVFVHQLSSREAQFLFLFDADILIHERGTLWNMLSALELNREVSVVVDQPCKDISFKTGKSAWERVSLAASHMTTSAEAQLCGQLYGIRAEIARNIYLPKDLAACEDGFIKALVCTDFLTHPVWPSRIQVASGAAHTFEAYVSPASIFRNQKRQMIGQTIVHILVDTYLNRLPLSKRAKLGETLRHKEQADPDWLKRLIAGHMQRTRYFWRLYPGLLTHRFTRLRKLNPLKKAVCFPAALAGFFVTLISSFLAYETLKGGSFHYWPPAGRSGFRRFGLQRGNSIPSTAQE